MLVSDATRPASDLGFLARLTECFRDFTTLSRRTVSLGGLFATDRSAGG